MFLCLVVAILFGCHQNLRPSTLVGKESASLLLPQNTESGLETVNSESHLLIQLKEAVYPLFFRQGIFAGQDGYGDSRLKYQRWQIPLVMGTMLDFNRDYLQQVHDFLPLLAGYQPSYGTYPQFLEMLYKINNWDAYPKSRQHAICRFSGYCLIIDDRLWWVNFFISYAEDLYRANLYDPVADKLIGYSYGIFTALSRKQYLNTRGTKGSYSLMWHSGIGEVPYYKSTISNSLYVTAGARLAELIRTRYGVNDRRFSYQMILTNTRKVADGYFLTYSENLQNGLKKDGLLLDGVGTGTQNPHDFKAGRVVNYMFTYNQGVILPGMLILGKLTHESKYDEYARNLLIATINYSNLHDGFWDDYGYKNEGGWFADYDGIAFRLAYWQYLAMYLRYFDSNSDAPFFKRIVAFIASNRQQLQLRRLSLSGYGVKLDESALVSPNHNNINQLPQGEPFSCYPDGYSIPGIAAAMQIMLLDLHLSHN